MKKFLSLFLSVVMLMSITAGIDLSASAATGADVVSYANKFIGYPYVINTHGPNAFDCSGFVYYVYKHFNINLSTASSDYYNKPTNYGTKITSESSAQPGDVCVWSGHVGIYVGSGKVINALNPSKGVCTIKISEYINSSGTINPYHFFIRVNGISSSASQSATVTVKFNGNGGTASAAKLDNIKIGGIMGSNIPTATRSGYIFDGWYTAKTGGTKYTNSTTITSGDNNRTLYAHWISKLDSGCTGNLKQGHLYRIVNKKSGYALQPSSDSDGALVKQQAISNTNRQIWKVGVGSGCIFYNGYGGKCLDIKGSSLANGAVLQLYGTNDNGQENRVFSLVSRGSGYYSIHPNHSGRAIDIQNASTSAGAQVQQYYYTGNNQQLFSFQEITNRNIKFYDNLSNNYLPTPREVYNHSGSTNPKDCYVSRNTDYVTTSVNASQNKLTINAKKAGASGKDMTFATTVNGSYNFDLYDSNTNTMYLCFTAKSSVQGAKMYFRWGYDSAYKSITLNTTATNYMIELPRTLNSGSNLHPYIDRACTVEMTNIQLKSNSAASVDLSKGDTFNHQTKTYNVNSNNGTYGSLPQPTAAKSGYEFDGWYTDRIGGTKVTSNSKLNYNTKLYAHWRKTSESSHTHSYDNGKVTKKATCKVTGVKTYTCIDCGATKTSVIEKMAHTYKSTTTKATLTKNGKIVKKCTACGEIAKTTNVYYPKTIKLNKNTFTTNGKVQKTVVTVKDSKGNTLKLNKDYTVSYSNANSKNVGRYTVTVKLIGNYSGSKTFPYYINPKPTEFVPSNKGGFKAISKGFTLKWNKQNSQTTGYQIQYATKRDFSNAATITIANPNTTSYTLKGRAANKRYYVRVRTYKKIGNGTFYSNWNSGVKSVVTLR